MKQDPLQTIKQRYIPLRNGYFFREKRFNLDTFGLTYAQRTMLFVISIACAGILYFFAMSRLMLAFINPMSFIIPYLFANALTFNSPGFILGFLSYYKNVFKKERAVYTTSAIISTVLTVFVGMRNKIFVWICFALQIVSFGCVIVSFIPGGLNSLKSMSRLIISK